MYGAKVLLRALFLFAAFGAIGWGGCACPSRVPVSLEPLNDWLLYHGRCAWRYPYSCPCCPYVGDETVEAEPSDTPNPRHPQTTPQENATGLSSNSGDAARHDRPR